MTILLDLAHRAEQISRDHRYIDPEMLGDLMLETRKTYENGKTGKSATRLQLEAEIARLNYDIACLLQENKILPELLNLVETLFYRVGVIEKAIGGAK